MPTEVRSKPARKQHPELNEKRKLTVGLRATIVAVLFFAAVNAICWWKMGAEKVSHDMWGGSGSIDLSVSDYAKFPPHPRVVLLGSSLMMYPFWAMDKEQHAEIGDIFHHHRSLALEEAMKAQGVKNANTYSFAIFGQMVSDAYIYVNEYLRGDKAPEYLVYGVAPRDFSDFDLPAPMATLTFKRLVSMSNFGQYALLYLPSFQEKMDFLVGHTCFFYGRRWKLQHEVSKAVDKTYAFLHLNKTEAQAAGEQNAGFMLAGRQDVRWSNSLSEYKRRYRDIENKDLSVQYGFLERLLQVCAQRHIKVILVNMPLTDVNRALFQGDFYERYRANLAKLAARPGVTLVDLGASPEFDHGDFWDTTHLNHAGGRKLITHVIPLVDAHESGKQPSDRQ